MSTSSQFGFDYQRRVYFCAVCGTTSTLDPDGWRTDPETGVPRHYCTSPEGVAAMNTREAAGRRPGVFISDGTVPVGYIVGLGCPRLVPLPLNSREKRDAIRMLVKYTSRLSPMQRASISKDDMFDVRKGIRDDLRLIRKEDQEPAEPRQLTSLTKHQMAKKLAEILKQQKKDARKEALRKKALLKRGKKRRVRKGVTR